MFHREKLSLSDLVSSQKQKKMKNGSVLNNNYILIMVAMATLAFNLSDRYTERIKFLCEKISVKFTCTPKNSTTSRFDVITIIKYLLAAKRRQRVQKRKKEIKKQKKLTIVAFLYFNLLVIYLLLSRTTYMCVPF